MEKFLVKTIINGIVVVSLLMWFTEATFVGAALTAVVLSTIAYLAGDQLILRATNNTIATLADAALAFVFIWMVSFFSNWNLNFTELLVIVLVLGLVEFTFHRMLGRVGNPAR
ncbi:MAG TPA: DUF2512 family protein [Bacilli bacterium]